MQAEIQYSKSRALPSLSESSFLRYLTFLSQFILLLLIFTPEIDLYLAFGCATWVFAARTFMPKVSNLERLGIRALAVVFFAEVCTINPSGPLVAVALLWLINLAIPSLIGLFLLGNHSFNFRKLF